MGAGKDDLWAARGVFDFRHQGANAVVNAETLAADHFFAGHIAFSAHFEADGQPLGVDGLDDAADDLAELFFVMPKLGLAFCIADTLLDYLTSSLSGDPAEVVRGRFNGDHAAYFSFCAISPGLSQRDLGALILHGLDHFFFGKNGDLASIQVDF